MDLLRQRSRPYLFSNTLAPAICAAASCKLFDMLSRLHRPAGQSSMRTPQYFRAEMGKLGFDILAGTHPIVPVMLYDAKVAQEFADRMLEKGVYVVGLLLPGGAHGQGPRCAPRCRRPTARRTWTFAVQLLRGK